MINLKLISNFHRSHMPIFASLNRNITLFKTKLQKTITQEDRTYENVDIPDYVDLGVCLAWNNEIENIENIKCDLIKSMRIIPNFISEAEEDSLFKEIDPYLKKMRYEFDHWDDAIHGFKETERSSWSEIGNGIIKKAQEIALSNPSNALSHVHVLDLDGKGYIKPHVDSVRFCGDTVAGICLLSPAVMRLRHSVKSDLFADFLLSRRCFYIMNGSARYDFSHEILKTELSYFRQKYIERTRRISLISRSHPDPTVT